MFRFPDICPPNDPLIHRINPERDSALTVFDCVPLVSVSMFSGSGFSLTGFVDMVFTTQPEPFRHCDIVVCHKLRLGPELAILLREESKPFASI